MIAELTGEQQARFPEFVEKWRRIGLCTDPANRPAAEEAVRISYRTAGLDPPRQIVWCDSPLSMVLARFMVQNTTEYRTVASTVRAVGCFLVRPWVHPWVVNRVQHSVGNLVRSSVSSSRDSVWDSVCVRSERAVLPDAMSAPRCIYGQHGAAWHAFYDYFRLVCGLSEQTEKMLGLTQVAENAGWWMPCQDICWISERTNRLRFDDRGRLHCEDGPALSYPDGFSVYSIHGVQVEEQLILRPKSQDLDKIRNEPNAEIKRIRIERFGWAEYLRKVGATVLDTRDNEVEATKEALMETPDGQVVLVCACPSTSRVYCLEVPPTVTTCEAAQDWLSGGLSARVINGA